MSFFLPQTVVLRPRHRCHFGVVRQLQMTPGPELLALLTISTNAAGPIGQMFGVPRMVSGQLILQTDQLQATCAYTFRIGTWDIASCSRSLQMKQTE